MNIQHRIETAIFDFTFANADEAFAEQVGLDGFVKERLMTVVDEVFTKMHNSEKIIRFEQIAITLEKSETANYRDELPGQLRQKLTQEIQKQLWSAETHDSSVYEINPQTSELDLLRYYLNSGCLPWQVFSGQPISLDELILRVLRDQPNGFKTLLKSARDPELQIKRLVSQFPKDILVAILQCFSVSEANNLLAFENDFKQFFQLAGLAEKFKCDSDTVFQELVLHESLFNETLNMQHEHIISCLFRRLSMLSGIPYKMLLDMFSQTAAQGTVIAVSGSTLATIIHRLQRANEEKQSSKDKSNLQQVAKTDDFEQQNKQDKPSFIAADQLVEQLQQALKSEAVDSIKTIWAELLEQHPQQLMAFIKAYRDDDVSRKLLQQWVPKKMLDPAMRLLAAENKDEIEAFINDESTLQQSSKMDDFDQKNDQDKQSLIAADQLVEQLQQALISEAVDSIKTLWAELLEHHPQQLMAFIKAYRDDDVSRKILQQWVPKKMLDPAMCLLAAENKDEIEALINDESTLQQSSKMDNFDQQNDQDKQSLIAADQLVEQLQQALISGAVDSIKTLWAELLEHHPQQLLSFIKAFGCDVLSRKTLVQWVPEMMLGQAMRLLAADDNQTIEAIISSLAVFLAPGISAEMSVEQARKLLRELSLAHLLQEYQAPFKQTNFIDSLLRRLSVSLGKDARQILDALLTCIDQKGNDTDQQPKIQQSLQQLDTRITAEGRQQAEQQNRSLLLGYDYFRMLQQRMTTGELTESCSIEKMLQHLEKDHPALLLRLFREIQAHSDSSAKALQTLSEIELRCLVRAWFSVTQTAAAQQEPAELWLAITKAREQVNNGAGFYQNILLHLLQNQLLDFTEIPAEVASENGQIIAKPARSGVGSQQSLTESATLALLKRHLMQGQVLQVGQVNAICASVKVMLANKAAALQQLLRESLQYQQQSDRLVNLLPETSLLRVLMLRGEPLEQLLSCADSLASASLHSKIVSQTAQINYLKWQFIFSYLYVQDRSFSVADFTRRFAGFLLQHQTQHSAQDFLATLSEQLVLDTRDNTRAQYADMVQSLSQSAAIISKPEIAKPGKLPSATEQSREQEEPDYQENIYINNAGLVLVATYLPQLFQMLKLTEQGAFKNRQSAERAVHLLQFMVNGVADTPEYLLVLNKLLCGVKTGVPIIREITLSDAEKAVITTLLQGIITNWKALGNTSINGLQESFFQREGRLRLQDDNWHLLVQARPFDMLLDQLPWSYAIIKHPWMEGMINVQWR